MKIISGGQSGVDRAALDAAIANGMQWGGWCPKGGWAEDFPDPPGLLAVYPQLRQTPERNPAQRTEWNVRDGDAALIITGQEGLSPSRGTQLAHELTDVYSKPVLTVDVDAPDIAEAITAWLLEQREEFGAQLILSIGGPRESEVPGIYARTRTLLDATFSNQSISRNSIR